MPGSDTSDKTHLVVLHLARSGSLTQKEIAATVRRHPSTISKIISQYKTSGAISSASHPGRPANFSPQDKRRLIRTSIRNRFQSSTQLLDTADLSGEITPSRANQLLRSAGLNAWHPKMKPFLSKKHTGKQRRLAWAQERKDWAVEKWCQFIFTDESTFETGKPDGSLLVWRRIGKAYHPDCIRPTFISGRSTSNHWGGIHYTGQSALHCLQGEGQMTAAKYVEEILRGQLKEFYLDVKAETGQNPTVIKDNASCHTSKVAKAERQQ